MTWIGATYICSIFPYSTLVEKFSHKCNPHADPTERPVDSWIAKNLTEYPSKSKRVRPLHWMEYMKLVGKRQIGDSACLIQHLPLECKSVICF